MTKQGFAIRSPQSSKMQAHTFFLLARLALGPEAGDEQIGSFNN
jgi:hypothetical protein